MTAPVSGIPRPAGVPQRLQAVEQLRGAVTVRRPDWLMRRRLAREADARQLTEDQQT